MRARRGVRRPGTLGHGAVNERTQGCDEGDRDPVCAVGPVGQEDHPGRAMRDGRWVPCPYGAVLARMLDFNTEFARRRRAQTNRRHLAAIQVSVSAATRAGPPHMSPMAARYAGRSSVVSARLQQPLFGQGIGATNFQLLGHYELVVGQAPCGILRDSADTLLEVLPSRSTSHSPSVVEGQPIWSFGQPIWSCV
jgi:hypothetical protein